MRRTLRRLSSAKAWLALAVLPVASVGLLITSPDRLLDRAYSGPIVQVEAQWASDVPSADVRPVSLAPSATRRPFVVGDRLTIDAQGGAPETIEITAIEHVDGSTLGLDGVAFQMVTGRSARDPGSASLRFLFAVDTPEKARAL